MLKLGFSLGVDQNFLVVYIRQNGSTNQIDPIDKSGIRKQKQRLEQKMRLRYKVAIEQIEQVRIDGRSIRFAKIFHTLFFFIFKISESF